MLAFIFLQYECWAGLPLAQHEKHVRVLCIRLHTLQSSIVIEQERSVFFFLVQNNKETQTKYARIKDTFAK